MNATAELNGTRSNREVTFETVKLTEVNAQFLATAPPERNLIAAPSQRAGRIKQIVIHVPEGPAFRSA